MTTVGIHFPNRHLEEGELDEIVALGCQDYVIYLAPEEADYWRNVIADLRALRTMAGQSCRVHVRVERRGALDMPEQDAEQLAVLIYLLDDMVDTWRIRNEPNLESPGASAHDWYGYLVRFGRAIQARCPEAAVFAPAPSPGTPNWVDWLVAGANAARETRAFAGLDVHAYGNPDEVALTLATARAAYNGRIVCSEHNFGAGRTYDLNRYAADLPAVVQWAKDCRIEALAAFIWHWQGPDMPLPTPVDVRGTVVEQAIRKINEEEIKPMSIAVALLPSNQDKNQSPIRPEYNEYGGLHFLAPFVEEECRRLGINAKWFPAALESRDNPPGSLAGLKAQQVTANQWLAGQPSDQWKALVNFHTDSGDFSHTFGIYGTQYPSAVDLATAIAQRVHVALDTGSVRAFSKLGDTDYSTYIFATYAKFPAVLIELCTHTVARDINALFGRVRQVAQAIAQGIAAWAGFPDEDDETEELRAEVARLKGLLGQIKQLSTV